MKRRARNICLQVAYDGTNYHGFQRQQPPVMAIQNVLEKNLEKIFGDSVELAAAGRTDAGVHALGQVVNFFTDGKIPLENIPRAANGVLPKDIVILAACEADFSFSARHSALGKTYVYHIQTGLVPNPFNRHFSWHLPWELDVVAMQNALKELIGIHDFSSFRASGGADMSPVRTLYRADLCHRGDILTFTFKGNGFLYHMVRNIVGTVVNVGRGKISPVAFKKILAAKNRSLASPTAPPQGLFLAEVEYEKICFPSASVHHIL